MTYSKTVSNIQSILNIGCWSSNEKASLNMEKSREVRYCVFLLYHLVNIPFEVLQLIMLKVVSGLPLKELIFWKSVCQGLAMPLSGQIRNMMGFCTMCTAATMWNVQTNHPGDSLQNKYDKFLFSGRCHRNCLK